MTEVEKEVEKTTESGKRSDAVMSEIERQHVAVSEARLVERGDLLERTKKWNRELMAKISELEAKLRSYDGREKKLSEQKVVRNAQEVWEDQKKELI